MSLFDRIFGRPSPVEELERDLKGLLKLAKESRNIMATQAEAAAELAAKTAQIRKAIDEIVTKIAALEEAVKNSPVSQELADAIAALGVAVQAADDIVPDAPTPTP